MKRALTTALLALALGGCIDTSVEATSIQLRVAGTATATPVPGRDGAQITLERADVAFGPLYLCAGFTAGELCDEALAEWRDAVVVDALSPEPVDAGEMVALTGTARSYMYDHGIVSRLTSADPLVTSAAEALGGSSAVVRGRAEIGGQVIPFELAVPIAQSGEVEQGVPVVRSAESSGFEQEILPDDRLSLTVRFDASEWLASADFGALIEDAECAEGRERVCAGALEQTCAADGTVADSRDCAALGMVCLRERGCAEAAELGAESQPARALRAGIEAGARPSFEFADRGGS